MAWRGGKNAVDDGFDSVEETPVLHLFVRGGCWRKSLIDRQCYLLINPSMARRKVVEGIRDNM